MRPPKLMAAMFFLFAITTSISGQTPDWVSIEEAEANVTRRIVETTEFKVEEDSFSVRRSGKPTKRTKGKAKIVSFNLEGLRPESITLRIEGEKRGDRKDDNWTRLGTTNKWASGVSGTYFLNVLIAQQDPFIVRSEEFKVVIKSEIKPDDPDEQKPDVPDPDPEPETSPFKGKGLRVLLVYETEKLIDVPFDQRVILQGAEVQQWLNENCVLENGYPAWRVLDQDTIFPDGCQSEWCTVMKRNRESLPWVIVGNGESGYEGPLPANKTKAIELFKKFK